LELGLLIPSFPSGNPLRHKPVTNSMPFCPDLFSCDFKDLLALINGGNRGKQFTQDIFDYLRQDDLMQMFRATADGELPVLRDKN
jgi:hypothetical protein